MNHGFAVRVEERSRPLLRLHCALGFAWFVTQTLQCFAFFQLLVIPFIALEFILLVSLDGMATYILVGSHGARSSLCWSHCLVDDLFEW